MFASAGKASECDGTGIAGLGELNMLQLKFYESRSQDRETQLC